MDFRTTFTKGTRSRGSAGFTLVETLVAAGIGTICLAAFVSIFFFGTRSFRSLFNYEALHSDNRVAADVLTRDIRQALRVTSYTTNSLTLQDADGLSLSYTYSPSARTFTRTKGTDSRVLLTECDRLSFRMGERNPIAGGYDVYPAASGLTAKVVDVAWSCSREILGVRANTETVQTARIVIRKQGN
jgi:type II secretory pathway component PulJ